MPEKTTELMSMAAECRKLAELAKTEMVREQLLESAAQFERVAEHLLLSIGSLKSGHQDSKPASTS